MVIDRDMISAKLILMRKMLRDLEPYGNYKFLQYQQDKDAKYKVERNMHLLVECSSDILNHVLADRGLPPADSYADTFVQAGLAKLLDAKLAEKLVQSAKMRNRLVHLYSDIDDKVVFDSIKYYLQDFVAFSEDLAKVLR